MHAEDLAQAQAGSLVVTPVSASPFEPSLIDQYISTLRSSHMPV